MTNITTLLRKAWVPLLALAVIGCSKKEKPSMGDFPSDSYPPGGALKFYTAFDGTSSDPLRNAVDSIRANFPQENPLGSTAGISGAALQGLSTMDKAVKYGSANDFAQSTSMTIAFWMKQTPTVGGAQFVFSMPKKVNNSSWTTNTDLFMLIEDEGQSTSSLAAVKVAIHDQWFEFVGANRMPGNILNGQWHHMAIVYDETTSKLSWYVDGQALTALPSNLTDVKKSDGSPKGPLTFTDITGFVIAGWSQHVGLPGPGDNPEAQSWAKAFSGSLDQFRLYNKALTAAEVLALFNSRL